jgi:hypothetical protein
MPRAPRLRVTFLVHYLHMENIGMHQDDTIVDVQAEPKPDEVRLSTAQSHEYFGLLALARESTIRSRHDRSHRWRDLRQAASMWKHELCHAAAMTTEPSVGSEAGVLGVKFFWRDRDILRFAGFEAPPPGHLLTKGGWIRVCLAPPDPSPDDLKIVQVLRGQSG